MPSEVRVLGIERRETMVQVAEAKGIAPERVEDIPDEAHSLHRKHNRRSRTSVAVVAHTRQRELHRATSHDHHFAEHRHNLGVRVRVLSLGPRHGHAVQVGERASMQSAFA
eukprot:Amastigsp_a515569_8.p3 type:complete len:111 gc:universal Amastigsp_a515569_8:648-316(-)